MVAITVDGRYRLRSLRLASSEVAGHCISFKINLQNNLNTCKKTEWFSSWPAFLEMHFGLDFVEKSES